MLEKQNIRKIGFADISDLQKDPLILWQHNYYPLISIVIGIVFPAFVASLWGDLMGGFYYGCMMRIVFVHHATFFVNSLAHTFGEKSFSDHHTAFDSFVTAILTLGEGYHNYHHEFPQDYRNGIKFFHYDPTKWLIRSLSYFNLTYNLQRMSQEEVEKARLQMLQKKLDEEKAKAQFGRKCDRLPSVTQSEFNAKIAVGEQLVILEGIVHDVKNFVHEHPGGRQTLLNFVGKDITDMFHGRGEAYHTHSKDARNYLPSMRIAVLSESKHNEKGA